MNEPRFSVVLPAFDRSAAIRATIDSVLAQDEPDFELLVVSDASADDTDDVVRGYGDRRVRLLRRDARAGHPGAVRNDGLAAARGRYVAYVDHDDRWRADHLGVLGHLLDGGADVAAACAERIDERGAVVGRSTALDAVWHPEIQALAALFEPSRVAHRRDVVVVAGGWTTERAGLEDWELWLRLADGGARFATTARRTALLHTSTATRTHELPMRYALTLARVPSPAHARAALAYLRLPAVRARLRRLHVACAQAWYEDLARSPELVLPGGVEVDDLRDLVEHAVPDDTTEALVVRPRGDHAAIARPLACTSREHAARIEAVLRRRFAPKLAWLARAAQSADPGSAEANGAAPRRGAAPRPRHDAARGLAARPPDGGASNGAGPAPSAAVGAELAVWHSPTSVTFGPGAVEAVGPIAAGAGGRAVVVTDAGLAGGPAVAAVTAALAAAGVEHRVYAGACEHPSLDDAQAAAQAVAGAKLVVGVGGGSAMDVAKVAALLARSPQLYAEPAWERSGGIVMPALDPGAAAVPLVQVPTSPATGSEVTALASLTDARGRKRLVLHPALRARAAFVDPRLHVTLPASQTARAAAETLLRLVVPYLTERGRRPLADGLAEATMRVVLAAAPRALADPADLDARGDLALAAASSQLGWSGLGRDPFGNVLFYLEHGLATVAGVAKGDGMAAMLPAYLRAVIGDGEELARLGRPQRLAALGASVLDTPHDARAAAGALTGVMVEWGLPQSLTELGVCERDVPALADATLELWGERRIVGWLGRERLEALLDDACRTLAESGARR